METKEKIKEKNQTLFLKKETCNCGISRKGKNY